MQKLTHIYQGKITADVSEKGWCLMNYGNTAVKDHIWIPGVCLVFYPKGFCPDEAFGRKLESFSRRKRASLLWIENPEAEMEFWHMTAAIAGNNHVQIGNYWVHLTEPVNETEDALLFAGAFGVNDTSFSLQGGVALSLADEYGTLMFTCSCAAEEFRLLDVGIKYVKPLPGDAQEGWKTDYTEHLDSFVIEPVNQIDIPAQISPAAIWNPEISFFDLGERAFLSTFLSKEGQRLALTSCKARLVFEKSANAIRKDSQSGDFLPVGPYWYLGADGTFQTEEQVQLMPGLAGTEYLSGISELKFMSGQNGMLLEEDQNTEIFRGEVTTPWIAFRGAYCSSSVSMPFFALEEKYLRPYTAKLQKFRELSPAFPAFPWAGLSAAPDTLEAGKAEDYFSKIRYRILAGEILSTNEFEEEEKVLIAPCGLCAGVQPESGEWNWVGIAQTRESGLPDVRIAKPSLAVRKALQQSKCVYIASTREEFSAMAENAAGFHFDIDGWNLSFSEDTWDDNCLFMIKYTDDVTVRSLLGDCPRLKNALAHAYDSQGNLKNGYEAFLDILDRKEFQGVLMLGGAAEAGTFSPELKTILKWGGNADIGIAYMVISNGKLTAGDTEISVAKSEVNALIQYESSPSGGTDVAPFDFCTRELVILIEQTRVKYFRSRSELSLYELFGAKLHTSGDFTENPLVLSGRLEMTGDVPAYKFSLVSEISYRAEASALTVVEIQNVTVSGGEDRISFSLDGSQAYTECEGLDLFSYERIGFSGVLLVKQEDGYYVDYSSVHMDTEKALVRENSFVKAFGAEILEIQIGVSSQQPEDLGYLSINTPVRQGRLGDTWNGIVWRIPLNSSGRLGKNEALNMDLLAAWCGTDYYIGIRTGGIFGKSFSLQGILTAGFHGITMENGTDGKVLLILHGFALEALSFSFPPGGVDVCILGENGRAAWYAAYEDGGKTDGL